MSAIENKKRKIAYIFCYARSGGTLLNRFLSNIDDLVILSEAHNINFNRPNAGMMSIKNQVKKWYGIEIESNNYLDAIDEIADWCEGNGKILVLRDWPYIDFARSNLNNYGPSKFSLNYELLSSRFDLSMAAFVRDGIDVFLSSKHDVNQFSEEYLDYVKYLQGLDVPIVKYEDFCDDCLSTYQVMAKALELPDMNSQSSEMFKSDRVVGDINYSRGNAFDGIKILKRRHVKEALRNAIDSNDILKEANQMLGYKHQYTSRTIEDPNAHIAFKLKSLLKKVDNAFKFFVKLR